MVKADQIPQPKTYGPLGNVPLMDKDAPTLSLMKMADEYGPIFRMEFFGGFSTIVLSGHEWVAEVCNDAKFDKSLAGGLHFVRAFAGDGLFTGKTQESNWQKAHNILVPSFSQQAMKGYHSMMVDIALQLVQKWSRQNPNESIDVPDNMTRLTLDTIGLCGFNYRFNSFYQKEHNPFIISMVNSLDEAMHQSVRLPIQNKLSISKKKQFEADIKSMFDLVDELIAERREQGDQGETDLLARMLTAKDPQTGEQLDDENIRFQIITFLIAGHETTSGLLSFALYLLLKNPDVLKKAYQEVDQVFTSPIPTYKQVTQLKYIRMILNEALRLYPTAPQFTLYAKEDMMLGGQYPIKKRQNVVVLLPQLHRDKTAWGEDAEEFRPERFEDPKKVPHDAYKPFGNGQRACIGMQFALHEATLVLGMILQHFELVDHTDYKLKIKQTMTLKPDNFSMKVKLRDKKILDPFFASNAEAKESNSKPIAKKGTIIGVKNRPLLVLYGSNMGTAEGVAREIADLASSYGVSSEVAALDDHVGKLPTEGALIIVTSSYNGKPPKNARKFVKWLDTVEEGQLEGVHYAVFGCGDKNWSNTYQNVPTFIDEQLTLKGATRFSVRGEADASGEFEKQLGDWKSRLLADALNAFELTLEGTGDEEGSRLSLQFVTEAVRVEQEAKMQFTEGELDASKLTFPEGVNYKEGDKIGVFPINDPELVNRILGRFKLNGEDVVVLKGDKNHEELPLNQAITLSHLLTNYVDVKQPITREQLKELAAHTVCPPHKFELESMAEEGIYEHRVLENGVTIIDLLEKYEACEMSFERFLEIVPTLKPKFYSVSSSKETVVI